METGIVLFHGSKEIVEFPEIRKAHFNKDFYFGFYLMQYREQAIRWATRYSGIGYLSKYDYIGKKELKILTFEGMTEEWLDFVVSCRLGKPHDYDVVEGPMANDTIFNYVQNFVDGKISKEAFWALAKFKRPTHQISFHTAKALESLKFIGYEEITNEEK